METGERNSAGEEDDDEKEVKEGERSRKRVKKERLI